MQFPENELGLLWQKCVVRFGQRKFVTIIVYFITIFYLSIPSFSIPLLEYDRFRVTAVIEQRAIENGLVFYPSQSWSPLSDVNPNLLRAIISMEDGKFFTHKGIDWEELEHSLKANKRKKRIARGGSTITMQLAKNLFLSTDRNVFRKAKEMIITLRMEKEISKQGILRNYVNAVEWGEGIFGIKKASEIYFHKEPASLSVNECARLAAVIPSPLEHKPTDNSAYVLRRSGIIRERYTDIALPF